jgi:23S rRNA (guanosine2251-2'-O)-methyltransferase
VGSGGQRRAALEGRKATPKAEERTKHPAARRASLVAKRQGPSQRPMATPKWVKDGGELVGGRNAVLEALRAKVPVMAGAGLIVAMGVDSDDRLTECLAHARKRGIDVVEVPRAEMDKAVTGQHQGLVLQVPPYSYLHPDDLLALSLGQAEPPLLVALDGVTDPRNLGSVVRSTAAFGGHGVLVPERRAAGVNAGAWKASAGALARLPVARAVNLTRSLSAWQDKGVMVIGLAADGSTSLDDLQAATGPVVIVVGSEGRGLSRLVSDTCDLHVSIPMGGTMESLNAGVAAGVVLAEVSRLRRRSRQL